MAKKIQLLSVSDIVLGADSETIQQALEKRSEIDQLLAERRELYQKIADVESKIEAVWGEPASFPFPDPSVEVASYATPKPKAAARKKELPKEALEPGAEITTTPSSNEEELSSSQELTPDSDVRPAPTDTNQ